MAISFPRDLPFYFFVESTFELLEGVVAAAYADGRRINRSQITDPVWKAHWETRPLTTAEEGQISAFMRSLRGGLKTFLAYDAARASLIAYPNAQASTDCVAGWNGTGTITAINNSAGTITIANFPAGLVLSPGDRVGLEQNGRYGYFEVLEGRTGNGALSIAPYVPTIFTTAAVCRLWRPKVEFFIDWQSWQLPGGLSFQVASFDAYQVL